MFGVSWKGFRYLIPLSLYQEGHKKVGSYLDFFWEVGRGKCMLYAACEKTTIIYSGFLFAYFIFVHVFLHILETETETGTETRGGGRGDGW